MAVDHLAPSALPYDLFIALFIVFAVSFGFVVAFAAKKIAQALKRTGAHDLGRAAIATPPPMSGTLPAFSSERSY